MNDIANHQKRFCDLWQLAFPSAQAQAEVLYTRLTGHYDEAGRRYHNLDHIFYCLSQFDAVKEQLSDPLAVELAVWFHDIIYVGGACDNEARSAETFVAWSEEPENNELIAKVSDLIMDTRHCTPPQSADGRYLADVDLSCLALPWKDFSRDSEHIRQESPKSDADFYSKQLMFLEMLASRESIYYTHHFQQRYEQAARLNLERQINYIKDHLAA